MAALASPERSLAAQALPGSPSPPVSPASASVWASAEQFRSPATAYCPIAPLAPQRLEFRGPGIPVLPPPERRCQATARSAPRRLRKATKSERMSRQATADAATQKPPGRRTSTTPTAELGMHTSSLGDAKVHFSRTFTICARKAARRFERTCRTGMALSIIAHGISNHQSQAD
jgi:hypothetical protein